MNIMKRRAPLWSAAVLALGAIGVLLWQSPLFGAEAPVVIAPPAIDNPRTAGPLQTAVLAGGCFWGVQGVYEHVRGVRKVIAGYAGGRIENVLMGAMDIILAFPSIILAIAITTILGPSITNLMIAVGIVYIPQYARLARASVLGVKETEYVEAARAIGAGVPRILARHVLPNILAPLLIQATLGIATAELEAAGLSYLGLGARPPAPEWGAMLNDARDYWVSAPWALIFPGLAITALVLGFNLLGDGLREALDPNAR